MLFVLCAFILYGWQYILLLLPVKKKRIPDDDLSEGSPLKKKGGEYNN